MILESNALLENTINAEETKVAKAIEKVHNSAVAPTFYNNEQALRSVVRFAYISAVEEYSVIQEMPSGKGIADIVFIAKKESSKPSMIIELKWNKSSEGALNQIKQKNYPEILKQLSGKIMLVGISYDEKTKKHECRIEQFANE